MPGFFNFMTYDEQLQDPRWFARRKQILERDDFCCQDCLRAGRYISLHVHHKSYVTGWMAWEYPDEYLITLCDECHEKIHGLTEDPRSEREKPVFVHGMRDLKGSETRHIGEVIVEFINSIRRG